jgi:hypothetical protein
MNYQFIDLNIPSDECLAFDSSSYSFWATCVNATSGKVEVTQVVFNNLMEGAKSSCFQVFCVPFTFYFYVVYYLFVYLSFGLIVVFPFICLWFCELVTFLIAIVEFLTWELISRFPTSYLMYVMRICYPQYWFQGDIEENFNQHLLLIKAHYCFEKLWEPIKTSKASLPLVVPKICPIILFTNALDM